MTLTDGLFEGEPYVEGDASRPTVEYMPGSARYGDLDGDGVDAHYTVDESGSDINQATAKNIY